MSSTHTGLYFHFVFSTKARIRCIKDPREGRLHSYLRGIIRKLGGVADTIGGDMDHVLNRIKTFQEEYLELLRESGIEFDERYLW